MQKIIFLFILIFNALLLIQCKTPYPALEKVDKGLVEFTSLNKKGNWKLSFEDNCIGNWQEKWTLDGLIATVENSKEGMHLIAGSEPKNDAHHTVLWTKESFIGDLKIEYDYTRTDSASKYVNIIYIQATGLGEAPYTKDIAEWKDLREVPTMSKYFNNMNTLHISYAAFTNASDSSGYIRARRYPKTGETFRESTKIAPSYSYENKSYFKTDETYHITVIKKDKKLFFQLEGKENTNLFEWDLSTTKPITEGRIGLRQMYTRSARYKNFKVYHSQVKAH